MIINGQSRTRVTFNQIARPAINIITVLKNVSYARRRANSYRWRNCSAMVKTVNEGRLTVGSRAGSPLQCLLTFARRVRTMKSVSCALSLTRPPFTLVSNPQIYQRSPSGAYPKHVKYGHCTRDAGSTRHLEVHAGIHFCQDSTAFSDFERN